MSWREKRSGLLSSRFRGPYCMACQVSSILLNFEKLQFSLDDYCNEAWKCTLFPCVFVEECRVLTVSYTFPDRHEKYVWPCSTIFPATSEYVWDSLGTPNFCFVCWSRAQESYVSESVFTLHDSLQGFGFFQACESVSNSACAQVVPTIREKVTEFRAQAYSASLIVHYWHFHARMKWCDVPKWRL